MKRFRSMLYVGLVALIVATRLGYLFLVPIEGTARAIDGDSLMVGDVEIRLWGIQAPEFDTPEGKPAYGALAAMIDGKHLTCWRQQLRHSFDRVVARCENRTGRDVGALQVRAGHAKDWPLFFGGRYAF